MHGDALVGRDTEGQLCGIKEPFRQRPQQQPMPTQEPPGAPGSLRSFRAEIILLKTHSRAHCLAARLQWTPGVLTVEPSASEAQQGPSSSPGFRFLHHHGTGRASVSST